MAMYAAYLVLASFPMLVGSLVVGYLGSLDGHRFRQGFAVALLANLGLFLIWPWLGMLVPFLVFGLACGTLVGMNILERVIPCRRIEKSSGGPYAHQSLLPFLWRKCGLK